jgi:broad specificity phosphatase PhoE
MKSFPRKPFYLVRHGESFANRFEYPSGRMDTRLTRLGWDQAHNAAGIVSRLDAQPSVIVASALVRARETAKLIHKGMDCALTIDRHLGEQYYGSYQGVSKQRIREQYGHEIWWVKPTDGEGMPASLSPGDECDGKMDESARLADVCGAWRFIYRIRSCF